MIHFCLLIAFVYVYVISLNMFMNVHVCGYVCVHICVCVCRGQQLILNVFDCSLSYISTQVLLLKLKLTDLASLASQFVLGTPDPCFPESWDCRSTWRLCGCWVSKFSFSYTRRKQFKVYPWSHCFNPSVWNDDLNLLSVIFNSSI